MKLLLWKLLLGLIGLVVIGVLVCGCGLVDHSPVITGLEADKTVLLPSEVINIECNASGVDGGTLSYNWSTSGGAIHARGSGESAGWTAPAELGNYTITVNVTDEEGNWAVRSVTIRVRLNHPPIITILKFCDDWIVPSGKCQLECLAEDLDSGDILTYEWEAEGGNISGSGSPVTWTAPEEPGIYNISVVVRDELDAETRTSLPIVVAAEQPAPVIQSLTVTTNIPAYIRQKSGGYEILQKSEHCTLECIAADPNDGELHYIWSTERGGISGNGAKVTWTLPPSSAEGFVITVMVADGRGGIASEDVTIKVRSCFCGG